MDTVYLKSGLSYEDTDGLAAAVETLFAQSEAAKRLGPDTRVLLKPNLLGKHTPDQAVTTHPAVVAAVAQALHRRGVRSITLADSPGGLYNEPNMRGIYRASGLAEVCAAHQIDLWQKTSFGERPAGGRLVAAFSLIDPVLDCDFLINLPKLKTHVMTGMTCAVKNLFGCVPGLQKAELHMRFPQREAFGTMLCDLCGCVKPDLTVADGIVAMEGDGPSGGSPRALGLLLGGEDPFLLDLAAAAVIGIEPAAVPYLAVAIAAGRCPSAFDPAALAPCSDALCPAENFKLPASFAPMNFAASVPAPLRWAMPLAVRMAAPRPRITRSACVGCGKCAEICPGHTITLADKKAKIDPAGCIRCFCCHEMCPAKAIKVRGLPFFKL